MTYQLMPSASSGSPPKFLGLHSKSILMTIGVLFVLVLGFLDYLSGPTVSISVLYLIPITLVTWNVGRNSGIVLAVMSALVWLAADLMWPVMHVHPAFPTGMPS